MIDTFMKQKATKDKSPLEISEKKKGCAFSAIFFFISLLNSFAVMHSNGHYAVHTCILLRVQYRPI